MDGDKQDESANDTGLHLSERALANRWDISMRTLQRMRGNGQGPAFLRIGNSVRYAMPDVQAFEVEARQARNSGR